MRAWLAAAIAVATLGIWPPAFADGPPIACGDLSHSECPTVQPDGYVYLWDGRTLTRATTVHGQQTDPAGVVWEVVSAPACPASRPETRDITCLNAATQCPTGQILMHYWQRQVAPAPPPGPASQWRDADPALRCVGGERTWTMPDLVALAREYVERHVHSQQIAISPPDGAIVGLPLIVSTTAAEPLQFAITQPFPGMLAAQPSYAWSFGDGATAEGAGVAYDGHNPTADDGYYVSHQYARPGMTTVTLTTTWRAVFTVGGNVISLDPISLTTTRTTRVRAARSELVAND
jgi:hypothetical protein